MTVRRLVLVIAVLVAATLATCWWLDSTIGDLP